VGCVDTWRIDPSSARLQHVDYAADHRAAIQRVYVLGLRSIGRMAA
jgi:hypothetical protein